MSWKRHYEYFIHVSRNTWTLLHLQPTTSGKWRGGDAMMPGPSPIHLKGVHGDYFTPRLALTYAIAPRRGRVQCQANISGIYTTQSDCRTGFSPSTWVLSCQYNATSASWFIRYHLCKVQQLTGSLNNTLSRIMFSFMFCWPASRYNRVKENHLDAQLEFQSNQDNTQSSKKNNKYQFLYTYGCTSWW